MVQVTLAGAELEGFTSGLPAGSVRLLLPAPGNGVVVPSWNGNEFLLPDGRRPIIRTFTPLRFEPAALELDLQIVVHGRGVASDWAEAAEPGAPAAVSGPGRGYTIDPEATTFVIAGDETAIPAITQLLTALPLDKPVQVCVEVGDPAARLPLPDHPAAGVAWFALSEGSPPGDALVAAVRRLGIPPDSRVWVAGEAAAVQRIRRHLFEERGIPRPRTSVRGYWKHGRSGDQDDDRAD